MEFFGKFGVVDIIGVGIGSVSKRMFSIDMKLLGGKYLDFEFF